MKKSTLALNVLDLVKQSPLRDLLYSFDTLVDMGSVGMRMYGSGSGDEIEYEISNQISHPYRGKHSWLTYSRSLRMVLSVGT